MDKLDTMDRSLVLIWVMSWILGVVFRVVVFVVNVEYSNALFVPKIERAITKHGEITAQTT